MTGLNSTARELANEVLFLKGHSLALLVEGDSDRVLLSLQRSQSIGHSLPGLANEIRSAILKLLIDAAIH